MIEEHAVIRKKMKGAIWQWDWSNTIDVKDKQQGANNWSLHGVHQKRQVSGGMMHHHSHTHLKVRQAMIHLKT